MAGFPDERLRLAVEAYVGDEWVDVRASREVMARSGISLKRGRQNESPRPQQSTADLVIKQPTGKWSPRNPRSPYFGKIKKNTPLRIALDRTEDEFTGRTSVDSWGTTSDGTVAWALTGTASAFDVAAGVGTIVTTTTKRTASLGAYGDCDVLAKLRTSALDASLQFGLTVRYTDANDHYGIVYSQATASMSLLINAPGGSSSSTMTGGSDVPVVAANTWYWMRVQCLGDFIRGKLWADGDDEPGWIFYWYDGDVFQQGVPGRVGQVGVMTRSSTAPTATVSCDYFEVNDWRFHGEIPSWPPRWNGAGTDVHAPITASGILRRLDGGGAKRLASAMTRAITDPDNLPALVAYNPAEEGSTTTQVASGIDSGPAMTVVGTSARFGSGDSFAGSDSLMVMGADTQLRTRIPLTADTGEIRFRMLCKFPAAGVIADNTFICEIGMNDASTRKYVLNYRSTGDLQLLAYDQQWTLVGDSGVINFNLDGLRAMIGFQVVQNGANVDWQIAAHKILDDDTEVGLTGSGSFASLSVGAPLWYVIAPNAGMTDAEVGHFAIVNDITALNNLAPGALTGWAGELAAERFERLGREEGIECIVIGEPLDTPPMGPQLIDTLVNNLLAVEQLDAGQIFEPRQFFGLAYRPGRVLTRQRPAATMNYANREVFEPPPQPEDDDLLTRNDVTVERVNGSRVRATLLDGPMSTRSPDDPDDPGIGTYEDPYQVTAFDDGQLRDIAYWRLHVGTYDGYRWPTLNVKRAGLARKGKADLSTRIKTLDIGEFYALTDLPDWLPPEDETVLTLGISEYYNDFQHDFTFAGVPGAPYDVVKRTDAFDNPGDIVDSAESVVNTDLAAGGTSLSVAVLTMPLWKTGTADFDIMADGVRLHVTNIGGASSPQTFTVDSTPVNGISKTVTAGSAVNVFPRRVRSLPGGLFSSPYLVAGADTPDTAVAFDPAVGTGGLTSIGTYVPTAGGAPLLGTSFVASADGVAILHMAAQISNSGAAHVLMSFSLKSGALLDQGEEILAPSDSRAIELFGTDPARVGVTVVLSGLDPRQQYNVVLKYRITAGTGTVSRRLLVVKPAGTVGALPGEVVPHNTDTRHDRQDASDTTVSTSYTTADMTVCGNSFVAPASGRVLVHLSGRLDNNGANTTFLGFEARTGSVVGSGTVVTGFGADDSRSISRNNINEVQFGRSFLVTGLTAGDDYNVRLMHRVTAGTGTIEYRHVIIEPTT
jgi:hypothetical protein